MNIDLLRRLCETPGVPGHEERVRDTRIRINPTSVSTESYVPQIPDTTLQRIAMDEQTKAAYQDAVSQFYKN